MGVGYHGLQFALLAKRRGANFARTITLGRQHHYLDNATLRSMFQRFQLPLSAAEEQKVLAEAYSEELFKKLGATVADSVDASDYERASITHDFNKPVDASLVGKYTCFVDFGSLEHVFNIATALKNSTDLLEVGGHFLSVTTANNFMGHGFYQFSPELFFNYLMHNGFTDVEIFLMPYRAFPFFFRVADPREIRGRVELVNAEPVLMGVIARKKKQVSVQEFPIQSDYYDAFWRGRDVNRAVEAAPGDPQVAAAMTEFKTRVASLISWPESVSPRHVYGFDNSLHYRLFDPALD
jgi:hypothetical protein